MSMPPEASLDWCHSCLKLEPLPAEYYIVCGECGHVYLTGAELLAETLANIPDRHKHPRYFEMEAEDIFHCPLCAHDF